MKESTSSVIFDLFTRYPKLETMRSSIENACEVLIKCFKDGRKMLVCGNGGSAADALHITGELMKSFCLPRKLPDEEARLFDRFGSDADYIIRNLQGALPVISLVGEIGLATAYSNDIAADLCFAQQVYGLGNPGDILFAISTSGSSSNVIYAAEVALAKGMHVIALTGDTGGRLKALSSVLLNAPSAETYKIQEYHLPIYHTICLALENEFFANEE